MAMTSLLPPAELKYSVLRGCWMEGCEMRAPLMQSPELCEVSTSDRNSNILGDYGRLEVAGLLKNEAAPVFDVAVAQTTHQNLAYYGATLLECGDTFQFNMTSASHKNTTMAITLMSTGENYVQEFIMQVPDSSGTSGAGGIYLEYHDLPHLHMPMNPEAGGYLLLAKKVELQHDESDDMASPQDADPYCDPAHVASQYHISAFTIPHGKAIYMGPNVIHNDCFLVGLYRVVYGATDKNSCVRLFDANTGDMVHLRCR